MSITFKKPYAYVRCDTLGCSESLPALPPGDGKNEQPTTSEVQEYVKKNGWEIGLDEKIACPRHATLSRTSGFNLARYLAKRANYEGAQGYAKGQRLAWMNCVRCGMQNNKTPHEAWQSCLEEYQKKGNTLEWVADHLAEKVTKSASRHRGSYAPLIQKHLKEGMDIPTSVKLAIDESAGQKIEIRFVGADQVTQNATRQTIFDYPVVEHFNTIEAANQWAQKMGYRWVKDQSVYGGYWVDKEGNGYLPT